MRELHPPVLVEMVVVPQLVQTTTTLALSVRKTLAVVFVTQFSVVSRFQAKFLFDIEGEHRICYQDEDLERDPDGMVIISIRDARADKEIIDWHCYEQ